MLPIQYSPEPSQLLGCDPKIVNMAVVTRIGTSSSFRVVPARNLRHGAVIEYSGEDGRTRRAFLGSIMRSDGDDVEFCCTDDLSVVFWAVVPRMFVSMTLFEDTCSRLVSNCWTGIGKSNVLNIVTV